MGLSKEIQLYLTEYSELCNKKEKMLLLVELISSYQSSGGSSQ